MQFKHLNIPESWNQYFTKYPNGLSLLEALIQWTSYVNTMIDHINLMTTTVGELILKINPFIERVDGMYISTNDYTDEDKSKLESLADIVTFPNGLVSNQDNTSVIQTALNYAVTNKKKLKIPDGTFRISRLSYTGTDVEHLELDFSSNGLLLSDLSPSNISKNIISLSHFKSVKINGLKMQYDGDMTTTNQHSLLHIDNVEKLVVEDCELLNANKSGIDIKDCKDVKINGGFYNGNFSAGIEFGNIDYFTLNGATLENNGEVGDYSTGYGVAQANDSVPSKQTIITNCQVKGNTRKGIDLHEIGNVIVANNHVEGSGISGIALQAVLYSANAIKIVNNLVKNQTNSSYVSESGIAITIPSPYTVESIDVSGNTIQSVPSYGIVMEANGAKEINVQNNIIDNIFNGTSNGNVIRIQDSTIIPKSVIIRGNNIDNGNSKGILVESAERLLVSDNEVVRPGASMCLHFPSKIGDSAKVLQAEIHGNTFKGASNYFALGYVLSGADGVITDNRDVNYSYHNNTIINNDGTAFPLWEQERSVRKIVGVVLTASVPVSGTWVVGDRFEDTTNVVANGFIGRVCTVAGTPGTWKGYGALQP